jgi:PKD repeat protein
MLGTACGGGGDVQPNNPPVANFTAGACVEDAACSFTDTSTDDGTIASWSWNFDDNNAAPADNVSTAQNPVHTFADPGSYDVSLEVTDNSGEKSQKTTAVTVTSGTPGNTAPVAAFTYTCSSLDCTFTDASTDDKGVATYSWEFGDGVTSDLKDPTHSFTATASTPFNVKLTVADAEGATNSVTQVVTVTPPAGLQCDNGSGVFVACDLLIEQRARVTITMVSNNCNARGNTLKVTYTIPAEQTQTLFTNGCREPINMVYKVRGDTPLDAGTHLKAEMTSGSTEPDRVAPQTRVSGAFPEWTLEFDDGEDPSNPGEPDFNDIVLRVTATVVP